MKTLVGFFVAPLPSSLVTAYFSYANGAYHPLAAFVGFNGVLYALQVLIGIPAYLLLKRTKLQKVWAYMTLGAGMIVVPYLLYNFFLIWKGYRGWEGQPLVQVLLLWAYMGVLGAIAGLTFWLVARPDKPIRNAQAKPN